LNGVLKRALEFAKRRPLAVGTAAVLIGLFIQAVTKRSGDWIPVYVAAAQRLIVGEDIYQGLGYAYPPFMAMLAIPFTLLPPLGIRATFFALNALCAVVMVRAAWRIAVGAPIDDPQPWRREQWAILLFGLLCGGPYILNTFNVQQTDLLIGVLLIGGCLQLLNGRQGSGGALIGLAAACKVTPLLFVPYLFFRRQWIAGLSVGAVALAVNVLPNLVSTPPQGGLWLTHWIAGSVVQGSEQTLGAVSGRMGALTNLSLSGTTHRVINTGLEFRGGRLEMVERPAAGMHTVVAIFLVSAAALLAVSLMGLLLASRFALPPGLPPPTAVEYGLVVCLMLLLSPMSSSAHFNILVLPGFCLARLALTTRDRMLWGALAIAGLLFALTNKELVRETIYTVLVWAGSTTVGTLLLWWACVWALMRCYPKSDPARI
jgi:Glycosyltransferase family 87